MELKNKKINFLGDSITEGAGASEYARCYVEVLKRKYDLQEGRNYGISGTRLARQRKPSENPRFDLDFPSRVAGMEDDADIVVVFGGTNDHGHGDAPLCADSDRTADTFIGGCHQLYTSLLAKYPHSKIIVLTPLHRQIETRADSVMLEDYVNLIRKIAGQYGLTILDLYANSAICTATLSELTTDGLHPNDAGHEILATEIGEYLLNL